MKTQKYAYPCYLPGKKKERNFFLKEEKEEE
jgi:hypothetical protein